MSSQQQYNQNNQQVSGPPKNISNDDLLMYVVAFFCPPLAVFWLKNGCETETIITVVLWCLFWFPGFIYALLQIMNAHKERDAQQQNMQQNGMV